MKMTLECLLMLLSTFLAPSAHAAEFWVRPVEDVKAEYLWVADEPQRANATNGLTATLWAMPEESIVSEDGCALIGFAIVGMGDIGEIPVAFEIWGSNTRAAGIRRTLDGESIEIGLEASGCETPGGCGAKPVLVKIDRQQDARAVLVDGKVLGLLKSRL